MMLESHFSLSFGIIHFMSYDIRIWSINKTKIPDTFTEEGWVKEDESARLPKGDWQIVVNESVKVEKEDIPEEIQPLLPGIKYLTELNLEPIHAPKSAKKVLIKTAKNIAKDIVGIVEDPQDDTVMAPSGLKRFVPPSRKKDERFSILEMSWWFGDNPLSKEELLYKLVNYFEHNLPDALPRRYGEYEPPQHKYVETGKQHFNKYLSEHIYKSIVWYPTRPVIYVSYHFLKEWGFFKRREEQSFGANYFSIEFDAKLLEQPGWKDQLEKVFKDISIILNPFYGEVRTLHNYIYARGTSYSDMLTEYNPTSSGWWMGIPQKLGHAVVIGKPYTKIWPKLKEKGAKIDSFVYMSTEDWNAKETLNSVIGKVPRDIAQRKIPKWVKKSSWRMFLKGQIASSWHMDTNDKFPSIFPFDKEVEK